ncbi:MAG: hypothetical protein IKE23_12775 [Exiguobacterium sp.]|nr:hypothetical protein [Exiguobacterium sp.]
MTDGKVVFQIDGDARGVKTTIKDVTNDIEKESKKWDNAVKDSTDKGEGFFKGMLKGIVGAISAAGIAKLILDWGKAAIQAASDLQEVQNVVDVTFGDSARQIQTWSESAGKQYGLTETQAKRYASTIGAMLKSQGVAHEQMLSMSKDLAGLAADMASFYNLDFDTAFEKIRAGISGETMPLKQLGINMSIANLEAFALEQGITKSYAAMSQGEQTLLRYQYLMKATADAQGDFARTSDGFANATRRVEASLETIKTKGGVLLMQVVEPLTVEIASLLDMLTQADDKTALGLFADIDKEYAGKYAAVEATYNKASDLIEIIDELQKKTASLSNGSQISFEKLFGDIGKVEKSGGDVRAYLQGIGADVDFVMQKYNVWKDAIGQVTSAIPSLSAVIDEETGAIMGSTSAIQANVDEWKRGEEKKLAWKAYYAKASAVEERKASMYEYELDYKLAVKAGQEYRKELVTKYGEEAVSTLENLYANATGYDFFYGTLGWIDADMASKFGGDKDAIKKYIELINSGKAAKAKYKSQTEDLTSAEKELTDAYDYLIETYGEGTDVINESGDAWVDYGKKSKDAWQTSSEAAKTALKALADYAQGVHDATAQTVDGIVKGFAVLERPTTALEEKRSKLIEQQNELNRSTRDGAKRYEELQAQIDDLNKSLDEYSPKGMQDALQSQLAFMDEYIKNLEKAQQMGLSNDLLASLSDGSVQSAEYLASLVASPAQAAEVDALFQQVQAKKNEFTNALTEQKLTVDETYQGMVDTAKAAIEDMHMGAEASEATAETVQGMIDGLKSKMPALSDEIDAILAELNRLNGYGISIDLSHTGAGASAFGERFFGDRNIPAHETGLDYVPFDGYLASLHEGESVLTAEENRIWQRFKNGAQPQTMDYDALGATMRENVQAGGNVYLDGKTVGRVISDQQGNAYRQLQRSGWQQ